VPAEASDALDSAGGTRTELPAAVLKRRVKVVGKYLGIAAVFLALTGGSYEQSGRRRDRVHLPQIGQSVDIGGRKLNLHCAGTGNPPVIFDSGLNAPGVIWAPIQAAVAKVSSACWYDRAGQGWSEPGPTPRTSKAIAEDLHALLRAAGIASPYVLVGHSFGGFNLRVFNGLYPAEVAAMVLVDASTEDTPGPPGAFEGDGPVPVWRSWAAHAWLAMKVRLGLVRLMSSPPWAVESDPAPRRLQLIRALRRQPKALAAQWSAAMMWPESAAQVRAAGNLGDRPLVVLTAGKPADPSEADSHATWMHEMQPKLARLSTRGRQVIVEQSNHDIPGQAPAAVIDAVVEVVDAVRATTRSAKPLSPSEGPAPAAR
jgi:pimeloyl-ACP methyl ester carboxylesterase